MIDLNHSRKTAWPLLLGLLLLAAPAAGQAQNFDDGPFVCATNADGVSISILAGPGFAVIIPAEINGLPVTGIGAEAFEESGVTSVTIPGSVTSLGDSAFFYCQSLTNVTIANAATSIGDNAFNFCYALKSLTLGNGVTSIGAGAFYACYGLTSVTIPGSVASIGENAFADCLSLTNACFEGNAPSDGGYIFSEDTALSVIYYVNGASGWGTNFENIPTLPCAQCGGLPPIIQITSQSTHSFTFSCSTITNQLYQIQSATNLVSGIWTNLGNPITATNSTMILSEPIATNMQQFYRVVLLP